MRIHDLLDLASLLTAQGPMLVELVPQLPMEKLEQYWVAAHCRTERWVKCLHEGERQLMQVPLRDRPAIWDTLEPTAVEVIATDTLTRIWAAILISWDAYHKSDEASPIARSCYISHLEARNRVMQLMVKWRGAASDLSNRWNRLRRTAERTTDLLLATLPQAKQVDGVAFELARVRLFRREWHNRFFNVTARQGIHLYTQALNHQLAAEYPNIDGHVDLNGRLASGVLGCLHEDLFQESGPLRSLWQMRLYSTVTDVEQLVLDATVAKPHVRWRQ
ncbi:MAG: hypothetical protein O2931_01935 [Planctomycetota bacterium]|nr:hypothetical protein [Planctomycetota bacterium]MDA1177533.1 hypothetical protein [Planctomycetota bacterium]